MPSKKNLLHSYWSPMLRTPSRSIEKHISFELYHHLEYARSRLASYCIAGRSRLQSAAKTMRLHLHRLVELTSEISIWPSTSKPSSVRWSANFVSVLLPINTSRLDIPVLFGSCNLDNIEPEVCTVSSLTRIVFEQNYEPFFEVVPSLGDVFIQSSKRTGNLRFSWAVTVENSQKCIWKRSKMLVSTSLRQLMDPWLVL
jgi:hypothetical protein